jgi:hypothetical protein
MKRVTCDPRWSCTGKPFRARLYRVELDTHDVEDLLARDETSAQAEQSAERGKGTHWGQGGTDLDL